jgi:hypothetical protein
VAQDGRNVHANRRGEAVRGDPRGRLATSRYLQVPGSKSTQSALAPADASLPAPSLAASAEASAAAPASGAEPPAASGWHDA